MKRGTSRHSKMRDLAELLGVELPYAVGIITYLLEWAAADTPQGDIGKYSDRRIADAVEWRGDPAVLVSCLVAAKWVDKHDEHRLVLHDWPEHCEDSVHQKLAKQTLYFWDGQRPKFTKFSISERKQLQRLYADRATALKSAPNALFCAAEALLSANHAMPSQANAMPSAAANAAATFPAAAAAVQEFFPGTDAQTFDKIATSAISVQPDLDDGGLRTALITTHKGGNQRSAALWLSTLPAFLVSRAQTAHDHQSRISAYEPRADDITPDWLLGQIESHRAAIAGSPTANWVPLLTKLVGELEERLASLRKPMASEEEPIHTLSAKGAS